MDTEDVGQLEVRRKSPLRPPTGPFVSHLLVKDRLGQYLYVFQPITVVGAVGNFCLLGHTSGYGSTTGVRLLE
jgi:hypothetical protein